jgi:hypothetical protein
MSLNRNSTVPFIFSKEHLRMQIDAGLHIRCSPAFRRELAQAFQVSRMTASRHSSYWRKMVFSSRVGKGTFVRRPSIAQELRFSPALPKISASAA